MNVRMNERYEFFLTTRHLDVRLETFIFKQIAINPWVFSEIESHILCLIIKNFFKMRTFYFTINRSKK